MGRRRTPAPAPLLLLPRRPGRMECPVDPRRFRAPVRRCRPGSSPRPRRWPTRASTTKAPPPPRGRRGMTSDWGRPSPRGSSRGERRRTRDALGRKEQPRRRVVQVLPRRLPRRRRRRCRIASTPSPPSFAPARPILLRPAPAPAPVDSRRRRRCCRGTTPVLPHRRLRPSSSCRRRRSPGRTSSSSSSIPRIVVVVGVPPGGGKTAIRPGGEGEGR
mmetsp:Transcript_38490/g.115466  ORF Transcript_38490/g.115466 Transcript_38490/m.115466 type:complete len:217 (+) Transcript_38490:344-994(+)